MCLRNTLRRLLLRRLGHLFLPLLSGHQIRHQAPRTLRHSLASLSDSAPDVALPLAHLAAEQLTPRLRHVCAGHFAGNLRVHIQRSFKQ